jgi:protein-tyrosine phosphatase
MEQISCCAEILPGLWIGSLASVKVVGGDGNGDKLHQWTIISVLESEKLLRLTKAILSSRKDFGDFQHVVWRLPDKSSGDFLSERLLSILACMDEMLVVVDAEPNQYNNNKACLVHCAQGISRSAAVCAAWLLSRKKLSLQEALAAIRKARPEIRPNLGFLASLRALEQCDGDVEKAMQRMRERKGKDDAVM